jgi:hypothetical protein
MARGSLMGEWASLTCVIIIELHPSILMLLPHIQAHGCFGVSIAELREDLISWDLSSCNYHEIAIDCGRVGGRACRYGAKMWCCGV